MSSFDLSAYGITVADIRRNLTPAKLYAESLSYDDDPAISNTGIILSRMYL